eukprot:TRINITY_DN444_c0_g1_i3.p1 TRINITY_DN444_c0_g1~~TRINITY_DN444_c0_g1_i3.p1  ORF type:complete len:781 (-),score=69.77 TRINITY_DN444_c0_g1_i3:708-3050(-)
MTVVYGGACIVASAEPVDTQRACDEKWTMHVAANAAPAIGDMLRRVETVCDAIRTLTPWSFAVYFCPQRSACRIVVRAEKRLCGIVANKKGAKRARGLLLREMVPPRLVVNFKALDALADHCWGTLVAYRDGRGRVEYTQDRIVRGSGSGGGLKETKWSQEVMQREIRELLAGIDIDPATPAVGIYDFRGDDKRGRIPWRVSPQLLHTLGADDVDPASIWIETTLVGGGGGDPGLRERTLVIGDTLRIVDTVTNLKKRQVDGMGAVSRAELVRLFGDDNIGPHRRIPLYGDDACVVQWNLERVAAFVDAMNDVFTCTRIGGHNVIIEQRKGLVGGGGMVVWKQREFIEWCRTYRTVPLLQWQRCPRGPAAPAGVWYQLQNVPCPGTVWLGNESARRRPLGPTFDPCISRPPPPWMVEREQVYANMWRGPLVAPCSRGSCDEYKALLLEVICGGDVDTFRWLWHFFAYVMQRPWAKLPLIIVFRGAQGAGKSLLMRLFKFVFGDAFVAIGDAAHIAGRFNAVLANKVVVFLDEARWSGGAVNAALKRMASEDTFTVEQKGVDPVVMPNCVHLFLATNDNDGAVHLDIDDRRHVIFDIDRVCEQERYKRLVREFEVGGGVARALHELLGVEIGGDAPHVRSLPPALERARVRQKIRSLPRALLFLHHCLFSGHIGAWPWPSTLPLGDDDTRHTIPIDQALDAFSAFFRGHEGTPMTPYEFVNAWRRILKATAHFRTGHTTYKGQPRTWCMALPSLARARTLFQDRLGAVHDASIACMWHHTG